MTLLSCTSIVTEFFSLVLDTVSCSVFYQEAVNLVQGSLTREGFSTVPDVKWDDVGGLDHLRLELNRYIVRPIKKPDIYKVVINHLPRLYS